MTTATVNLTAASHEWANRPADERFSSLRELFLHTAIAAEQSREVREHVNKCEVAVGERGSLQLNTPHEGALNFSNWGFGQFCTAIGSNAKYMRSLANDPARAAYNLNEDIAKIRGTQSNVLYIDGGNKMLSCTSTSYGRCYNHVVADEIMQSGEGWHTLPAMPAGKNSPNTRIATEADCTRSTIIKPGDQIIDAGLYAAKGGENCFIFMVDDSLRVDDGTDEGLSLGFFAVNSEVGQRAFELTTFMYRYVCGNHIVWEAENVQTVKIKHIGDNVEGRIRTAIQKYLKNTRQTDLRAVEARVARAKLLALGGTRDEVSDALFNHDTIDLRRTDINQAYAMAEQYYQIDGSPRNAWGFAQGLTRVSQLSGWADERDRLDRAASLVLALAD